MTIIEIEAKYPIRNPDWHFDPLTNRWCGRIEELERNASEEGILDPWNRPFPSKQCRTVFNEQNSQVIDYWIFNTSVDGTPIECLIYNEEEDCPPPKW